jgi:hypothetical protein
MQNGIAALALVLDPPSQAANPVASDMAPAGIETVTELGDAIATAVVAFGRGLQDYEDAGRFSPATRELSGTAFARVAMILLQHQEPDVFAHQAQREGQAVLIQRYGGVLRAHYGAIPEAALAELISEVVGVAEKAVRFERAYQRAMAS